MPNRAMNCEQCRAWHPRWTYKILLSCASWIFFCIRIKRVCFKRWRAPTVKIPATVFTQNDIVLSSSQFCVIGCILGCVLELLFCNKNEKKPKYHPTSNANDTNHVNTVIGHSYTFHLLYYFYRRARISNLENDFARRPLTGAITLQRRSV